ncbi:MAG TPA: hypothetical protein VII20_21990 [Roseiarcus sp.]|jgi:hypothetical protein
MDSQILQSAMRNGAATAMRKRAVALRQEAAQTTTSAGEKFPTVMLKSPEAAHALRLAADWDEIAAAFEVEALS